MMGLDAMKELATGNRLQGTRITSHNGNNLRDASQNVHHEDDKVDHEDRSTTLN